MRIHARGFTLIEVLVALTIVAITLGAGIKAAGALTGNAERLAAVSLAQWCADNQLTELKLQRSDQLPGVGDTDFTCEQLGRSFKARLVIRPTPNPNFRRADAIVFDPDNEAAERALVTLSTVLARYR
ncbi:type II secretion system minor pseudopilin GspI [Roseateles toxinivorans]|uniref:Type II secretion system protein I n=1 Tax=Roseateles toxinivorans TaxID=270368 RepID=A0A4R6QJ36_9BURK|nr:type II secretion system minor pseudopilin GspI [Roseateles toxinivorans]TDP62750.1 type II secretion system protein I (GspI) [Roseateles toxinivorans]